MIPVRLNCYRECLSFYAGNDSILQLSRWDLSQLESLENVGFSPDNLPCRPFLIDCPCVEGRRELALDET